MIRTVCLNLPEFSWRCWAVAWGSTQHRLLLDVCRGTPQLSKHSLGSLQRNTDLGLDGTEQGLSASQGPVWAELTWASVFLHVLLAKGAPLLTNAGHMILGPSREQRGQNLQWWCRTGQPCSVASRVDEQLGPLENCWHICVKCKTVAPSLRPRRGPVIPGDTHCRHHLGILYMGPLGHPWAVGLRGSHGQCAQRLAGLQASFSVPELSICVLCLSQDPPFHLEEDVFSIKKKSVFLLWCRRKWTSELSQRRD